MGLFSALKKIFGSSNEKSLKDVELIVKYKTRQDTLERFGISEEDFNSSVQDNLDKLLITQQFDKFYNTINYLRNLDQVDSYDEDNDLKLEIAEEVSTVIYNKHNELLKESTQFKKQNNLNEAINTIYKAINNYPTENDRKSYYKLAYYYQLQKKWDDSWRVFDKVMEKYIDVNNPIEYQIINTEILQEEVKHLKREKKIAEYFYHVALATYANLVMFSINGAKEYVGNFFTSINNDFIDVSLIMNEKLQNEYLDYIRIFLDSKKENIFKLIEYTEKKTWQVMDRKVLNGLLKELHFLELSDYYNEHLSEKMSVLKA